MRIRIGKKQLMMWYITLYPVLDIIYTLSNMFGINIKLNQIIRGLMLLFMLLTIKRKEYVRKCYFIIVWIFFATLVNIIWGYTTRSSNEISFAIKMMTDFIVYYYFIESFRNGTFNQKEIFKCMMYSAMIASTSVLLSYVGFGAVSYLSTARSGVKGFFTMQSSLTIFLLNMLPIIYSYRKKIFSWQLIVTVIALASIGSKTGVIGTLVMLIAIIIFDIQKRNREHSITSRKVFIALVVGILAGSIGIYKLKDYISGLLYLYENAGYYSSALSFWLSNRNSQINAMELFLEKHGKSWFGTLFGYGYTGVQYMMQQSRNLNAIERDFHGVYYYFGLPMLIVVCIYLIYVFRCGVKINNRTRYLNDENMSLLYIWIMGIVYAFLGGHVLYEALEQFPFWIIGALIVYKYKSRMGE